VTFCQTHRDCTPDGMGIRWWEPHIDWGPDEAEMATNAHRGMGGDGENHTSIGEPIRQMDVGDGNEPLVIKPNDTAMNPWHDAKIKGNEPLA
jgi:hypothetical protein